MNKYERLQNRINEGFVILDGGFGSLLQKKGLKAGELSETWNITHPDVVKDIHKSYLAAGSDIIVSNSFGINALKYAEDSSCSLEEMITASFDLAKQAVLEFENEHPETAGRHFIGFDMGSLGRMLRPFGDLEFEDAVNIFKKSLGIAAKLDFDLIYIETMNDIYETKAAVIAAKESCDLPVFATTAYDERGKLLTGADPAVVVSVLEGLGVSCLGVNCSLGPDKMIGIVRDLVSYSSLPVIVKPNAGLPRVENGETVYDIGPKEFCGYMKEIAGLGARLLGGCCGTTPEYIAELRKTLSGITPLPVTEKDHTIVSSYSDAVIFSERPVIIGERINPTGKKAFKEALIKHDKDYILKEAIRQADAGADILDVNLGLPDIDEKEMLFEMVTEIQAVTNLPLQIDTADPAAMEKALRIYNGKAMINSVNGKEEIMDAVFTLAAKYGGLIVALTIDEAGIPETAEGRLAIAEKIYSKAAEYGIKKKDIIIDPLAMAISADKNAAKETLKSVKLLREKGYLSSLGVSNVSFGLPNRDGINSAFFTMAMQNGLNAAIMNPLSFEMMKAYRSFNAVQGLDENFEKYIDFFANNAPVQTVAAAAPVQSVAATGDELTDSIVKGLKESAEKITKAMLDNGSDPLDLINNNLVPALDIVGRGFEEKTIFLPQLLMAAEATAASFEVIKKHIRQQGTESASKGRIILATVKGDIHDIGKNIVKVLLENYGYDVLDLGKDVAPESVVDAAKREGIKLIGLSALMTTTVPFMEETIKLVHENIPGAKVVVGGAVLTQSYADMIHADKYAKDAMETVRFAEAFFGS